LINGMISEQTSGTVSLRNAELETTIVNRERIESLKAIPTSLMPDNILQDLTDDQVIDLFAYLMQGTQ